MRQIFAGFSVLFAFFSIREIHRGEFSIVMIGVTCLWVALATVDWKGKR